MSQGFEWGSYMENATETYIKEKKIQKPGGRTVAEHFGTLWL